MKKETKSTVFIVSILDFPDGLGATQFYKMFGKIFDHIGYKVKYLISYPPGLSKNTYKKRGFCDGIEYIYGINKPSQYHIIRVIYRIYSQIFFMKMIVLHRKELSHVVLYGTTFGDDLIFYLFKKIFHFKIISVIADDLELLKDLYEMRSLTSKLITCLKKSLIILQKKMIKNHKTKVIFVTTYLKKKYFNSMDGIKSIIVPTLFDKNNYKYKVINNMRYDILYAGTLKQHEGLEFLLDSFKIVRYQKPKINLHIFGVTEKSKKYVNILKKRISSLGLNKNVFFYKMINKNELINILQSSKVLVLPREDNITNRAGFSGKIVDYLMSGRPLVATDVGDISIYLKDNYEVLLTEPGDNESFAKKIIYVLDNEDSANKIGERGKEIAINTFEYKKTALRIKNWLEIN